MSFGDQIRRREGISSAFVSGGVLKSVGESPSSLAPLPPVSISQSLEPPSWAVNPKNPQLVLKVFKEEKLVEEYKVGDAALYTLGRSPEASVIVIDHLSISRRHAAFVHHAGNAIYLVDLGSVNGTSVDGELLKSWHPKLVKESSDIMFGQSPHVCRIGHKEAQEREGEVEPHSKRSKPSSLSDLAILKKVRCCHLLIKHRESRRPSSWRQACITRSKNEALKLLNDHRESISSGKRIFQDVAKEVSDCSSAKHGGDLNFFGRGSMQPAFESAAFSLSVGELSNIVDTDSGVHIILRTA